MRPLRTVTRIKSMKVLVSALLASLPDVADVVLLFGFFLLAFGVVGVEQLGSKAATLSDGPPAASWGSGRSYAPRSAA